MEMKEGYVDLITVQKLTNGITTEKIINLNLLTKRWQVF